MSRAEQYSWASLIVLSAVFWWFQMQMLDGWAIADQPAPNLLKIYFSVFLASTIAEVAIAIILRIAGGGRIDRDERDHAIEARANQNERIFFLVVINVIIWQSIWDGVFADLPLPRIDLASLPSLVFVMFTILFAGEMVKRVSTIWLYRSQSPVV
ncbi:MAG: hypothetical protein ACOZAA_16325 [Pseudomonadota bacterium]